jgi:hypothetical protein
VIYDTDDDNELIKDDLLPNLDLSEVDIFLTFSSSEVKTEVINPYPSFGAPLAWPRGYPMDQIRLSTNSSSSTFHLRTKNTEKKKIAVIQSLANHDPDVDAIYRLSSLPLPFEFNTKKTEEDLVGLQTWKTMSPYNAQATIHRERAFWLILLPISVHGRVSDIWRSYFAQRLLRQIGDVIAFASPWVTQYRNPHNYLADFNAEQDLYHKSTELVEYLANKWQCQKGMNKSEISLPWQCLEQLYRDIYNHGILEEEDIELVRAWINDLTNIAYSFPVPPTTI